jgi:hypothetical protein
MDDRTLPLLCDPDTHESLQLDAGGLLTEVRQALSDPGRYSHLF